MASRNRVCALIGLSCTFGLIAGRAEALCIPQGSLNVNDPKAYLPAFVDALAVLKTATQRAVDFRKAKDAMDAVAVFEKARLEYECVISYAEPFEKSTNEAVATSAQALSVAGLSLRNVSEAMRQNFKDLLDGKIEKPSDQAEVAGKLQVQGEEAWHFEMNAVVTACMSLIEFGPDKKPRIILTGAERADLLAKIRQTFGNPSSKGNLPPLVSSVVVLRDFLADDKRLSHDAP